MTIRAFHAKNYGCLRDVHVTLGTRLHAFVGPNDSGKSTLLRGIQTTIEMARTRSDHPGLQRPSAARVLLRCDVTAGSYEVEMEKWPAFRTKITVGDPPVTSSRKSVDDPQDEQIVGQLRGARFCQFDASALRSESGLVPQNEVVGFFDERGLGLPGIYQAILGRGDEAFGEIRKSVQLLFPTVKRIAVVPVTRSEVSLEVELTDGTRVRAAEISAGLLYYLAFAAIPHLAPVSALLLEEPENGLHPARIGEVIRFLRDFAERTDTQVFMATHSPLVLNELAPDEISVVTRPSLETGSLVTPLRSTPHFERRSKVYSPGELWLAYCDGDLEAPLLDESVK